MRANLLVCIGLRHVKHEPPILLVMVSSIVLFVQNELLILELDFHILVIVKKLFHLVK